MDLIAARRRVAATPLASLASLPSRLRFVGSHNGRMLRASAEWLVHSREHTNLTYELTALNVEQLAWFVANVTATPVKEIRVYIAEVQQDHQLREHIIRETRASARSGLADDEARYGRRVGWYALIRATRPDTIIETGTDKGLGSCVIAAALLRNQNGRLTTMDINPASGYLITPPYAAVVDRLVGDSVAFLQHFSDPVDVFLHDSDHSVEHERAELRAVMAHLSPTALVISDNSHVTSVLSEWAEEHGRNYQFFGEVPDNHWYHGDGVQGLGKVDLPVT